MAETGTNSQSPAASAPANAATSPAGKKAKTSAAALKKPRVKANHPPTAEMVNNAIKTLKERGGSSLQAIKKYLAANYKIDADKLSPFIKKYIKQAVINGVLIQTKGKGASGSFKLSAGKSVGSKSESAIVKKTVSKVKKVTAASPKKKITSSASVKKSTAKITVEAKKKSAVAAKSAKKAGTPKAKPAPTKQKSTKVGKSPVKKPKTPKPKKASSPKKAATATKKVTASKKK